MVASQNGWVANVVTKTSSQVVPGTNTKLRVRTDAPGQLLIQVAAAFHRLVEPIEEAGGTLDDWAYAERPVRGGTDLSNHASGTAIDLNALRHVLGKKNTFSPAQTAAIRRIVDVTGGVVRWGGDYDEESRGGRRGSRVDEMHFEINDGQDMADCERALAAMLKFNVAANAAVQVVEQVFETLWKDHYSGNPMRVGDLISWSATHAARANEQSGAALAEVRALRSEFDAMRQDMYLVIAEAVAEALGSYELSLVRK